MLDGVVELVGKRQPFDRVNGVFVLAVHSTVRGLPPQNHFRMVEEIAVDRVSVLVLSGIDPLRHSVDGMIPFLQEDDVRHHFRSGVGEKGVVWEADRAQQLRPLRQILPHGGVFGVHRVSAGHKSNYAARTNLVQCFGEKVVVNGKTELVVSPVIHLIAAKGYVAHSEVKEISAVRGFKSGDGDVCFRVELLGDPARDAVQLDAVEAGAAHFLRQHPEEIAHAH